MKNDHSCPFHLQERHIIITGASSGIGRQCAITCSQMGAHLTLLARNENRLRETYDALMPGNHQYVSIDLTKYQEIELLVAQTVRERGKISGLIHSAGIEMTVPFHLMQPHQYEELLTINVIAGFQLANILAKKIYHEPQGTSFVFIASVMGELGQTGKVGYCSSKGALIAGAKAMALELTKKHIRVNCVSPAIVETNMTQKLFETLSSEAKQTILKMHPLGLGTPEDIANTCVFLLSDASRWITGTNLMVDGGYSAQ